MQQAIIQNITSCTNARKKAQRRNRGVINTTLYDLVAAVADEVDPREQQLVAPVVSHILSFSRISSRVGLLIETSDLQMRDS